MQRNLHAFSIALVMVLACATRAPAAVFYNEAVDGDLSGDRNNPTSLALTSGTNVLISTSGGVTPVDRDYVHFTLPTGLTLDQVIMQSYTGDDGTAFAAVQDGSTFTEPPTGANPANLLGWAHFGPGAGHPIGGDILDDLGAASPAIGFTGSLAGPSYTFWLQQTSTTSASTYQLNFVVTPEPGSIAALSLTGLVLAGVRRHRAFPSKPNMHSPAYGSPAAPPRVLRRPNRPFPHNGDNL